MFGNFFRYGSISFLFVASLVCLPIKADQEPAFELPRTQVVEIQDSSTKRVYELHIQLPQNYSDEKEYSVVYMTDSPYTFPITTGAARYPVNFKRMENVMFVGISWQKGHTPSLSRQRDYTPTLSSPGFKDPSGEAARHLAFIRDDVIPYIEQRFSTDAGNRTYIGNSFGGLFGMYIFLTAPDIFKNYILGSPSVWWDNKYILMLESKTKIHQNIETNLFISVGADEIPAKDSPKNDMVGDAREFYTRLENRNLKKLNVEFRVIENATHATAFPTTAVQGLWWLFNTDTGLVVKKIPPNLSE